MFYIDERICFTLTLLIEREVNKFLLHTVHTSHTKTWFRGLPDPDM